MTCEDAIHALLNPESPLSDHVRTHLEHCEDCRKTRNILRALRTPPPQPAPELDRAVRTAAHAAIRKHAFRRRLVRILTPAAACAAVLLAALLRFAPAHTVSETIPDFPLLSRELAAYKHLADTALDTCEADLRCLTAPAPVAFADTGDIPLPEPVLPFDTEYTALSDELTSIEFLADAL